MSGVILQSIEMLHFLWLIPAFGALFYFAARRRRRALESFFSPDLLPRLGHAAGPSRRRGKAAAVLIALACTVIALTRPAWNIESQTVERHGRDVVFLLDVSKSMLAEDLAPNRFERAKLAILDCIERLQGDRIALVAFAGSAVVKCPLTIDYGFFRMTLEGLSTDSVTQGGTMIGDALRKTLNDVFDDQDREFKDIILITDGEDHESFPVEAAQHAGESGVRILAIGLGSESEGERIPVRDTRGRRTYLTYNDEEVRTRLDSDMLRAMVAGTPGGKYLNVATGAIDLGDVYTQLIAAAERRSVKAQTIERYEEKYQIFLAAAFVLLCGEWVTRERRRMTAMA